MDELVVAAEDTRLAVDDGDSFGSELVGVGWELGGLSLQQLVLNQVVPGLPAAFDSLSSRPQPGRTSRSGFAREGRRAR